MKLSKLISKLTMIYNNEGDCDVFLKNSKKLLSFTCTRDKMENLISIELSEYTKSSATILKDFKEMFSKTKKS